jgi:hypothetical protein
VGGQSLFFGPPGDGEFERVLGAAVEQFRRPLDVVRPVAQVDQLAVFGAGFASLLLRLVQVARLQVYMRYL